VVTAPIALLPAYVVSSAFSRVGSLRSYLSTLVRPRGNIVWYLVAFFTFPVIHLLGNVFTNLVAGRPFLANFAGATTGLIGIAVLEFMKVFFWSGGINEESGWRGFALPRLQSKLPPIMAGLIIWVVHTIWELLGDVFMDVFSGGDISWPAMSRLVWMPCWTILFIWVYNRTKGSILAPVIFHASMNMMNPLMGILPTTTAGTILLACFAFFAVISDRMWKKLPPDHLAVYPTLGTEDKKEGEIA
jgi:membrane protease YdiL (CAAX protease family)